MYSLGILLYHLVTGTYPLDGASPSEMREKHQRGERRRLRDARPDLPTEFVRIVERAIDPSAAARYQSAGELEADLAQFVVRDERSPEPAPGPAGYRPGGAAGRGPRSAGRRRRWSRWPALHRFALAVAFDSGEAVCSAIRSLVVLPLRNTSGDSSQDYFVDGMTEVLTADLSGISSLRVIADSAAGGYRNSRKSGAEIGRELQVDGVVEGAVSRSGDRVRVTLQVIQAGSNLSVWGTTIERETADAFRLQAEMAQAIVMQVKSVITTSEQQRLAQVYVPNPEVQDLYCVGDTCCIPSIASVYRRRAHSSNAPCVWIQTMPSHGRAWRAAIRFSNNRV